MADHGPVRIRTGKIDDLVKVYEDTYKKITKEIIDATESGKIQKAKVMARINYELEALGVDVQAFIKAEIPQYYQDGANQVIQDLKKMGIELKKTSGLAVVNRQAIAALTDEVSLAFADGITTMSRKARGLITNAQKQQINATIAQGKLEGSTLKAIAADVKQTLKDQGLGVLTDRGGRVWSFDDYARMLVKTKGVEARNQGLANRMLQNGYDLVQVTNHRSDHPECAAWESKILSLTGATPTGTELPGGYIVAGTYQDAVNSGLFHPNCQHAINAINPSLAARTKAYDNPYNYR